jgi:hypothetical protein
LRFNRDKRGYETTALVQAGGRRRGRGQRLLYFFRTPPGVRVGRAPIDEDAIRLLEEHNPDVQFDWTRILKSPPLEDVEGVGRRSGVSREGGRRDERRDRRDQHPRPPRFAAEPPASRATDHTDSRATDHTDYAESQATDHRDYTDSHATDYADHTESQAADHPDGQAAEHMEYAEQHAVVHSEPVEPFETVEPRYARLGSDGLGRLRARYAEVMARISERPMDDAAREELKLKAERLNPDAWVTADEVSEALEQYEVVFEELRAVVGRHPRRRPRR